VVQLGVNVPGAVLVPAGGLSQTKEVSPVAKTPFVRGKIIVKTRMI
jgi:hypothetical protein